MRQLRVKALARTYDVLIEAGLLGRLSAHLDPETFYVVIADDHIPSVYVEKVTAVCPNHIVIRFPQGEASKSLSELGRIIDIMTDQCVRKDACVIAVGGGVTGDLAGFAASVYLRGIPTIQIPTTLLAQIDSSVGGKVAIDTAKAKNAIGAIHPPVKVLIDPDTLKTLDRRQLSAGMAEMIKYGMIADKDFFHKIKMEDVAADWEYYIYKSLEIKRRFVEADEFDEGVRRSLNFGHTFGHAIEAYYDYKKYLHGEAIAIGMVMILSSPEVRRELVECLKKYNLPTHDPVDIENLKLYVNRDKKYRRDLLSIVDVLDIGSSVIVKSQFKL
ncbi:MAG TPA: 3-dehydroquinate synthase [Acholeplasmatales bacterium]|nr:3-dehydroquinate synthase [Acholeplasmatales bacterium]